MKERIEHSGVVERIAGDKVEVKILQSSACSGCTARKLCNTAESKEKVIECRKYGADYHIGDRVMVYGSMEMGRNAVILAFVVPLVLMVAWLFTAVRIIGMDELAAVGVMVAILTVYYILLHLFNGRISRKFEFRIEKIV